MAERRPDLAREHRLHDRFRGPPRASPVRFQGCRGRPIERREAGREGCLWPNAASQGRPPDGSGGESERSTQLTVPQITLCGGRWWWWWWHTNSELPQAGFPESGEVLNGFYDCGSYICVGRARGPGAGTSHRHTPRVRSTTPRVRRLCLPRAPRGAPARRGRRAPRRRGSLQERTA